MSGGRALAWGSSHAGRVRGWWQGRTFLGDVAAVFTIVTVVNSAMMVTGWDEPKTGTFAYVHLLGRLGIVTAVVGLCSLDELREWVARRRPVDGSRLQLASSTRLLRPAVGAVLGSVARAPVDSMARAYATAVTAVCLVTLGLSAVRAPSGGPGLYRNLLILAALLLSATVVGSAWQRRRAAAHGRHGDGI